MNQTQSSTISRSKTYEITITALMTAVTCILAPMSIPIGPVPIHSPIWQFICPCIFSDGKKEPSVI